MRVQRRAEPAPDVSGPDKAELGESRHGFFRRASAKMVCLEVGEFPDWGLVKMGRRVALANLRGVPREWSPADGRTS
jgi:hypothetical protein